MRVKLTLTTGATIHVLPSAVLWFRKASKEFGDAPESRAKIFMGGIFQDVRETVEEIEKLFEAIEQ